jgi:hypothetical protein
VSSFFVKDVGVALQFTVEGEDGAALDLTSATVQLIVRGNARSPFLCAVTGASAGQCEYVVVPDDFPNEGVFDCQIVITKPGNIRYTRWFTLAVEPALSLAEGGV